MSATRRITRDRIEIATFQVQVVSGPDAPVSIESGASDVTVGTAPGQTVRLSDACVSRHHCAIRVVDEGLVCEDLGSTNGTFIAGRRVSRAMIAPGDLITIGETMLSVELLGEMASEPLSTGDRFGRVLGRSVAMRRVFALLERVAASEATILLEGETGTGKSVLARWLHHEGPRADRPLVAVNCAALSETLVESELFGHERGAFTDAKTARLGLFEAADGGTLFLDEVGLLSRSTQAKLLTAIEEGVIRRLGGTREIKVDVKLIAASNRPLRELVASGAFREDLFHRLNLLALTLPPLRERAGDILPLARHLLARIAAHHRRKDLAITPLGEARLQAQPWRGNVRELAHVIESAVIFGGGAPLEFSSLGDPPPAGPRAWRNPAWRVPATGFSLEAMTDELIADVLREEEGNVSATARRLGVTRDFLRYRLEGSKPGEEPKA